MALNGFGSYVVVMLEVLEHWDSVNTELGGLPASDLVLQGGRNAGGTDNSGRVVCVATPQEQLVET
jgi:hypothetical protein